MPRNNTSFENESSYEINENNFQLTMEDIEELAEVSDAVRTRADLTPILRVAHLTTAKRVKKGK